MEDYDQDTISEILFFVGAVVSLALVCSFAGMRYHVGLGSVKAEEVPENTVLAVAQLKNLPLLKISDDGELMLFAHLLFVAFLCMLLG